MKRYDPKTLEPHWQKVWADTKLYAANDGDTTRQPYYFLMEFPYPSGDGLHVGHVLGFTAMDIMARHKRMQGFNVLYPIGFDAFGLPTENYAIKHKIAPQLATQRNVATFRRQFQSLGLSFDWDREINTTDPSYYRWTQWIFLQLLKKGLAYQDEIAINWCPFEKTGLANEEVVDGKHERCGTPVEKKLLKQWLLRITAYADRLIEDLKTVNYLDRISSQQINWIGRKTGVDITYYVSNAPEQAERPAITVFTTRPDTNFGASFVVLAPEHPFTQAVAAGQITPTDGPLQTQAVASYVKQTMAKSDLERQEEGRKKTGVFTGFYVENTLNGEQLPVWVSDFVLAGFGTGAVVGVPGHDRRDFQFAHQFKLPIKRVVVTEDGDRGSITREDQVQEATGTMINSGFLDGLDVHKATTKIIDYMQGKGYGKRKISYRLRDWVFSRQHYWGEPIPVVHCAGCAARERDGEARVTVDCADHEGFLAIITGRKTSVTRLSSPELEGVKTGDIVRMSDNATEQTLLVRIKNKHTYPQLADLFNDKTTLLKAFGKNFKTEADLRSHYELHRPGYGQQLDEKGIVGWDIELVTVAVPVPDDQLPVELPAVESYEPTDTGESPLAAMTDWVNTTCPACGGPATRETDTMPNWAGSSWYYLRYTDPHNDAAFASAENLAYWTPVNHYNGGMEHTTLHLLYSRFWHKFLFDAGLVPTPEPYAKRTSHGMILGPDNQKMSKSRGNVINPDHVVEQYGADAIRLYEMFMGPFDEQKIWSEDHLAGVSRFIYRVWTLAQDLIAAHRATLDAPAGSAQAPTGPTQENTGELAAATDRKIHQTLGKVHHDIETMNFNTAVSALMELINYLTEAKTKAALVRPEYAALAQRTVRTLTLMLAPFTPHLTEELWHDLGEEGSVHVAGWPQYDPELIKEALVTIVVQINGKVRANLIAPVEATDTELTELAQANAKVAEYMVGKTLVKTIVVPRKLVNFVVKS